MSDRVRPTHLEQIQRKCIHFTGVMEPACKAGVRYADVRGPRLEGAGFSLPCLSERGTSCAKRHTLTLEEAQERERRDLEEIEFTVAALKRINDAVGKKRGVVGKVECPKCKGVLHYSVAASNGHIWGKCETSECLQWMM